MITPHDLMTIGMLIGLVGLCMIPAGFITLFITIGDKCTKTDEILFWGIVIGFWSFVAGLIIFFFGGCLSL